MKHPPPEATVVLDSVLYLAYQHRNDGITYSAMAIDGPSCPAGLMSYKFVLDEPAPLEPTASSDRVCSTHMAECPAGQYSIAEPNAEDDRQCEAWRTCLVGQRMSQDGTATTNRQCEACSALHEECKDCECDDFSGEFAAVADNCKAACL